MTNEKQLFSAAFVQAICQDSKVDFENQAPKIGDLIRGRQTFPNTQWQGKIVDIEYDDEREDYWLTAECIGLHSDLPKEFTQRLRAGCHSISWLFLKEAL